MTTETTPAAETTAGSAADCATCPLRSSEPNGSYDYCPGCEHIARWCPSCRAYRSQSDAGWWWTSVDGLLGVWACGRCRDPLPDPEVFLKHPDFVRSHPEYAAAAARTARFTARVELTGDDQRFAVAQALARAGTQAGPGPVAELLAALAAGLRSGAGEVDVDCAAVDVSARQLVEQALYSAAYAPRTEQAATGPLAKLVGQWGDWLAGQLPAQPRVSTDAEREARDRAALRRGRERPVE